VREDGVAQDCIREPGAHRELDYSHHFACIDSEGGKAKNVIGVGVEESFHKATHLGEGVGAEDLCHGDFDETVGSSAGFGFGFAESDVGQFGIGEDAGGHLTSGGDAVVAGKVVADDAEVVEGDMGEVRTAGTVSDCPDTGGCGLKFFVDTDVAVGGSLYAGGFEPNVVGVWCAAGGNEEMSAFDDDVCAVLRCAESYGLAGEAFDAVYRCVHAEADVFVFAELVECVGDVGIFAVQETGVVFDDRNAAAEAAHGLSKLEADVAASENEKMLGEMVEFEGFDMRQRMCFDETGSGVDGCT